MTAMMRRADIPSAFFDLPPLLVKRTTHMTPVTNRSHTGPFSPQLHYDAHSYHNMFYISCL